MLVEGDRIIPDTQAILVYLAREYGGESWLPSEALELSQAVRWLSNQAKFIVYFVPKSLRIGNYLITDALEKVKLRKLIYILKGHTTLKPKTLKSARTDRNSCRARL